MNVERSASAKRPPPIGKAGDRSKARRSEPKAMRSCGQDAEMFVSHSFCRRSDWTPRTGVIPPTRVSGESNPERLETSTPPAIRSRSLRSSETQEKEEFDTIFN